MGKKINMLYQIQPTGHFHNLQATATKIEWKHKAKHKFH